MRLSNKHPNPQIISYSDFSGGLNTTTAAEMIQANELAKSINLEAEKGTGLLKTVAGLNRVYVDEKMVFDYMMYDAIGEDLLVTDDKRQLYRLVSAEENHAIVYSLEKVGTVEGTSSIEYTAWEDGILVAGGGHLQYYHDGKLETITDAGAPTNCHSPHVQHNRIFVGVGDELHYSGIGDEHSWTNDTGDASSAQWLQIGYKDGGVITGICALASDVVVLKSNRRAFRLAGAYPNWTVMEISRTLDCKGFNCCLPLANNVVVLGRDIVQSITTTDYYGDMRANDLSLKVKQNIEDMKEIRLRYFPSLNQIWFIAGLPKFLFLDANNSGYYQRQFHSAVVDAVEADGEIFVLKEHGIYRCDEDSFYDESEPMMWRFQGKTLTSPNGLLVKREWVDTTPYFQNYSENTYKVDKATIYGAVPSECLGIYHDFSKIYRSHRPIYNKKYKPLFTNSEEVYSNPEYVYCSDMFLKSISMYRSQIRQVTRDRAIKVKGYGVGGRLMINSINYEVVEV